MLGAIAQDAPEGVLAPGQDDGGFGLDLVARLSSAWGVDRNGDATTVWLELAAGRRAVT